MDGHILRLACAPFGVRTSNGPLALLVDSFYSILRRVNPAVERGGFVDDLWFYLTMSEHGECKGLAGGCVHCGAALARGRSHEEFVDALLQELHLERSDKEGALGQEGVFMGAVLNINTGRMGLTEKKYCLVREVAQRPAGGDDLELGDAAPGVECAGQASSLRRLS